jgi:hypothetical protein
MRVTLLEPETINNEPCYVISFSIDDKQKLLDFLNEYYSLRNILNKAPGKDLLITDVKFMTMKCWISQKTLLPVSDIFNVNFDAEFGGAPSAQAAAAPMKLGVNAFIYSSTKVTGVNVPVSMQVPREALEAAEVSPDKGGVAP